MTTVSFFQGVESANQFVSKKKRFGGKGQENRVDIEVTNIRDV
jgi:hypothetical protein